MSWNPADIDSEILAVHAALVPNGPQGEVVLVGGDEHWEDQQESAGNNSYPVDQVELHTPDINWTTNAYGNSGGANANVSPHSHTVLVRADAINSSTPPVEAHRTSSNSPARPPDSTSAPKTKVTNRSTHSTTSIPAPPPFKLKTK